MYAESLARGRRVVVVGDASLGLGSRLVALGARLVHQYDPDAERARVEAASAPRGVQVRPLPAGEFDVRDGAFDLAIVTDLASSAPLSDHSALVARVRRLVGDAGAALIAAPAGSIDYYELYDAVAMQFASVRMLGQVPFVGVTIAELGEGGDDAGVSVDTQLVDSPAAPQAFIALAGQRDLRLDPYTIVQLPASAGEPIADDEARTIPPPPREHPELEASRVALAEAQLRAGLLEAQLEEARLALTRAAAEAVSKERLADVESELTKVRARAKEAEAKAGDNHVRAERLVHDVRKLEEELERQRERNFRLTRDVEDTKKAKQKAEVELGMLRQSPELAQARERVALLEEALRSAEDVAGALQLRIVELEQVHVAREQQVAAQLTMLGRELEAMRHGAQEQLQAMADKLAATEARAARAEHELSSHGDVFSEELLQLERALRERAQDLKAVEQELLRRERIVQELVSTIEDAHAVPPSAPAEAPRPGVPQEELDRALQENARLRAKLDALAAETARREGDVQSAAWRISELEAQLSAARGESQAHAAASEGRLASALGELDALRQALTQEHAARLAAEQGADLTHAREELQRQSALIEQLRSQLLGPVADSR